MQGAGCRVSSDGVLGVVEEPDGCEHLAWRRERLAPVQRFRGGLVFKAHGLCESLNSRLESNKEEEEEEKEASPLPRTSVERGTSF